MSLTLGLTVDINTDNCDAVLKEALSFINPIHIIEIYYKYLREHSELEAVHNSCNLVLQMEKERTKNINDKSV